MRPSSHIAPRPAWDDVKPEDFDGAPELVFRNTPAGAPLYDSGNAEVCHVEILFRMRCPGRAACRFHGNGYTYGSVECADGVENKFIDDAHARMRGDSHHVSFAIYRSQFPAIALFLTCRRARNALRFAENCGGVCMMISQQFAREYYKRFELRVTPEQRAKLFHFCASRVQKFSEVHRAPFVTRDGYAYARGLLLLVWSIWLHRKKAGIEPDYNAWRVRAPNHDAAGPWTCSEFVLAALLAAGIVTVAPVPPYLALPRHIYDIALKEGWPLTINAGEGGTEPSVVGDD